MQNTVMAGKMFASLEAARDFARHADFNGEIDYKAKVLSINCDDTWTCRVLWSSVTGKSEKGADTSFMYVKGPTIFSVVAKIWDLATESVHLLLRVVPSEKH